MTLLVNCVRSALKESPCLTVYPSHSAAAANQTDAWKQSHVLLLDDHLTCWYCTSADVT
jgi:hypothetical protein